MREKSKQQGESTNEPSYHDSHPVDLPNFQSKSSRTRTIVVGCRVFSKAVINNISFGAGLGSGGVGCRLGRGDSHAGWVLSAAWVILTAVRLARKFVRNAFAVLHALIVPLGTEEVGDGLGVFGRVGGLATIADAAVVKGFLKIERLSTLFKRHSRQKETYSVAGICLGIPFIELKADQSAGVLLHQTPVFCQDISTGYWSSASSMIMGHLLWQYRCRLGPETQRRQRSRRRQQTQGGSVGGTW